MSWVWWRKPTSVELGLWSKVNHLYQLYPRIHRFGENLCYPIISHYLNPLPVLWCGSCSSFLLVFLCVLLCVIPLWVPCCHVRYDFSMKRMFGSFLPPVVWRWTHVLFTLFVFAHSGVQHILCCVFLCIVYLILPVSLDFPFLIAPSVLSSVYFQNDIVFQNVFLDSHFLLA